MRSRADDMTAETADWTFAENERLMRDLEKQSNHYGPVWGVDPGDLLQEVYLWLAARPELRGKSNYYILLKTRERIRTVGQAQQRRGNREELGWVSTDEKM